MGLLKLFSKPAAALLRLPSGSFTLDRNGRLLVCTVPSSFPRDFVLEVGQHILETFREAKDAQLPLNELIIRFGSLKITARELRGGAIVFLSPQTPISTAKTD